ncbi:MAG TPA: HAD hydrolase family protein [Terracidiphilus sp.]|nr:HAD hydrolase family protein [Terracidiphilus sp.]
MTEASPTRSDFARIRALALDVDGVLTDGGLFLGPDGAEWKRFCFADIMGLSLARRAGLQIALISGEDSPLVDQYAAKMRIAFVRKGCREKAAAVREFAAASGLDLEEICFMGDDVNDLPAMEITGRCAAPACAMQAALDRADLVTQHAGGNGAVRELVELILAARGLSVQDVYRKPAPEAVNPNLEARPES